MSKDPHTRNIVRLMITSGDHLLVAKYQQGDETIYFLPGGGIEYNESVIAAARRELAEEIGITEDQIEFIEPVAVYEHSWDDKGKPIHEISIVCKCGIDGLSSDKEVLSKESHLKFIWERVANLSTINFLPEDFRMHVPKWIKEDHPQRSFFASGMTTPEL
jgi:ADP-ribose pyrophosphatase YjhB (NUDIX family)